MMLVMMRAMMGYQTGSHDRDDHPVDHERQL
jgi:hypothetical protein